MKSQKTPYTWPLWESYWAFTAFFENWYHEILKLLTFIIIDVMAATVMNKLHILSTILSYWVYMLSLLYIHRFPLSVFSFFEYEGNNETLSIIILKTTTKGHFTILPILLHRSWLRYPTCKSYIFMAHFMVDINSSEYYERTMYSVGWKRITDTFSF